MPTYRHFANLGINVYIGMNAYIIGIYADIGIYTF